MAARRALVVLAHQEAASFNHAMQRAAVEALEGAGWSVAVSDLYAERFDPVLSRADFAGDPEDPRNLNYAKEAGLAWQEGRLRGDILSEVEKLAAADLVLFQVGFPRRAARPPSPDPFSVRPAHLSRAAAEAPGPSRLRWAWERVRTRPARVPDRGSAPPGPACLTPPGPACLPVSSPLVRPPSHSERLVRSGPRPGLRLLPRRYVRPGALPEKKAVLSFTTGGMGSMYTPAGIHGDINILLWPIQSGTLHFCGFQVLAPQIAFSIGQHTPENVRSQILEDWKKRLRAIWEEEPLSFAPNSLFELNFAKGFVLKKDVQEEQEKEKYGLTVGQHLGKPFPPDNQIKAQEKYLPH